MALATTVSAVEFFNIVAGVEIAVPIPTYSEDEFVVLYGNEGLEAVRNTDYTYVMLDEGDSFTFKITPTVAFLTKINDLIAGDDTEVNKIVVRRVLDLTTTATPGFVQSTRFVAREIDRIHMKLIQINERAARALALGPNFIGDNVSLEIRELQPNRSLMADETGTVIIPGPTVDEVANAQGYAEAAGETLAATVLVKEDTQDIKTAAEVSVGLLVTQANEAKTDAETALANTIAAQNDSVRYSVTQSKTEAERGQARANIGAGVLAGRRVKNINGNFDFWQVATVQTTDGYASDDMWSNEHNGSSKTHSRQSFALGQTDVPGEPRYFSRTVVTSSPGAGNFVFKRQKMESVRTLAGKKATITVYAKADAAKVVAVETLQRFGTGGSPSADVRVDTRKFNLTTSWQKFTYTIDVPSIAGKTLGSNNDDFLQIAFWFDAGTSFNANTGSLGHQSGTFDLARVSVVLGDATAEDDPSSSLDLIAEERACFRYRWKPAQKFESRTYVVGGDFAALPFTIPVMRKTPNTTLSNSVLSGTASSVAAGSTASGTAFLQINAGSSGMAGAAVNIDFEANL